jgi:TrmH family RNA methyltransferase
MITSRHNPRVQLARRLQEQAKARREQRAFVIEGVRLAEETLRSGWIAQQVLFSEQLDERGKAVVEGFAAKGVPCEQVSAAVMKSLSQTESPQGVMVILDQQIQPLPPTASFLLILDGLRDPGNLGTILRTATAASVEGVLMAPGCADAWSPKVLRSAMGAHFRLPLLSQSWQEIRQLIKSSPSHIVVYLADSAAGIPYTRADFCLPLALIVGGEAAGAGYEATSLADTKVQIPMPGGSESLNAAIAAGILLFEVLRQRGR